MKIRGKGQTLKWYVFKPKILKGLGPCSSSKSPGGKVIDPQLGIVGVMEAIKGQAKERSSVTEESL